jgi:hypothetical protein
MGYHATLLDERSAEMSSQDTNPADTAQPITSPVVFYGDKLPPGMKDWRPNAVAASAPDPVETEEEAAPKAESAPVPVPSYESPQTTEPDEPVTPAPQPAVKVSGAPKVASPGSPTSSGPRKMVTKTSD